MVNNYQVCSKCIMDSTVSGIKFDKNGVCNFCKIHDKLEIQYPLNDSGKKLDNLFEKIKNEGQNKDYDCIVGFSGGRDSTYTLYIAVKNGLRPLAVHFDNGWNSEIAVSNIKNITDKLGVDLHTVVANWEEFKDLQKSFLKASVSDAEVPTDYAINSVLYQAAKDYGVKYILNGHSFRTEGVCPLSWTYMDGKYVRGIHKIFGVKKIKSFPIMSMYDLIYDTLVRKIQFIHVPEFIEYEHEKVDAVLSELGWRYYGGHHHESIFTEFFQSYYLPHKFNIDKRKLEFSALIRSGQMTRDEALKEIQTPYSYDKEKVQYVISKLGLSQKEFDDIMNAENKSFADYPTYYPIIKKCKRIIKVFCDARLLPSVFYEKFLG